MTKLQSSPIAQIAAVARGENGWTLVARVHSKPGEALFPFDGVLRDRPSRDSVQISATAHIDLPGDVTFADRLERYAWCFLNHSCAPNTHIVGQMLIASTEIQPGDELRFDYSVNEFELAEPFDCGCGAAECLGQIRGFRWLSDEQRTSRLALASPWVLAQDAATRAPERRA